MNQTDNFTMKIIYKKEEPKPEPKPEPLPPKLIGTGTGFVIDKDYIVTADHVDDGCNEVTVRHKHKEYWTDVVARDPSNDLGLLRLEEQFSELIESMYK